MTAARTNQKTDAIVKALGRRLGGWTLALASDGGGVRWATTVGLTLAGDLSAAVWIHAINKPIWKTGGKGFGALDSFGTHMSIFILVLSSSAHRWLLMSTKVIKVTADILSWHEIVNSFKVCHLLLTSKLFGLHVRICLLAPVWRHAFSLDSSS